MSRESEIPQFPDINVVANFLLESKKISAPDVSSLKNDTQFQVFRIIGQNKVISTEEIEAKFETSQSLSMILSNLQADDLISQTSDYNWRVSDLFWDSLTAKAEEEEKAVIEQESEKQHQEILERQRKLKSLYKKIADQISDTSYVPAQHTVEDLFNIPEIEILAIIYQSGTISGQEIEEQTILDTSISLALSNLQADNLIRQNEQYEWQVEDNLAASIDQASLPLTREGTFDEKSENFQRSSDQSQIIEHKQLLKALLDIDFFPKMKLNDIIETPEFEILKIINSNSPIDSESIEAMLSKETPLSMMLSNLSADGLIAQSNDYRWVLAEDFRVKVSKVKVTQEDILDQIKLEEQAINPQQEPEEEVDQPEQTQPDGQKGGSTPKSGRVDHIRDILITHGYIPNDIDDLVDLSSIPEYEILKLLAQYQPLSSEELDAKSHTSSVSLTLSNLAADGLVTQREADFKYELTSLVKTDPIPQFTREDTQDSDPGRKVEESKSHQEIEKYPDSDETTTYQQDPGKSDLNDFDADNYKNLRIACRKAGYILDENEPLKELLQIPEFETLKIIGDQQPVTEEKIKSEAKSVSPVLISRTMSKLDAEDRITKNTDGTWEITDNFNDLLIEDELKEKERQREIEEARKRNEEQARLEAEKERRDHFIQILLSEGVIEEPMSQEKLMQVPEFELLWIIWEGKGELSEEEIKEKASSTSPVLISRTINQLEAKGRIQKTLSGKFDLSPDLRGN